jgi:hypothetical protein
VTQFEFTREAREKYHDAVAAIPSWIAAPGTRQKEDIAMLGCFLSRERGAGGKNHEEISLPFWNGRIKR